MDAKFSVVVGVRPVRFFALLTSLLLSGLAGCTWLNSRPPAASQEPPQKKLHPDAEVVGAPSGHKNQGESKPAADAEPISEAGAIERWAAQVTRRDDLRSRIDRQQAQQPAANGGGASEGEASFGFQSAAPPAAHAVNATPASQPAIATATRRPASETEAKAAPQPPTLLSVSARSAVSADRAQAEAPRATSGGLNAPETAAQGASLKEMLDLLLAQPVDSSVRQQIDRRLLQVIAGDYEGARQPIGLAAREQQEMVTRMVESLIAIRDASGGQPTAEANRVLATIEQLREALLTAVELELPILEICRAVRGFGQYDAIEPRSFLSGRENEFVVYAELRGFVSEKDADGFFKSRFALRVAVLNRAGDTVHELSADDVTDRCRSRRSDCFVSPLVRLPASLPPGEYVVKTTIHDKIGQKVAQKHATIRLLPRS